MSQTFVQLVDMLYAKNQRMMDLIEQGGEFGIFGTGKLARDSYAKIKVLGGDTRYFVDRNQDQGCFLDHPLHTIESASQFDVPLFIASSWAQEVVQDLRAAHFCGEVFIIDPFVTLFERMTSLDKQQLLALHAELADEDSKRMLAALVSFRCGDVGHLYMSDYPQYLSPQVPYASSDQVIDGGAYVGDTVQCLDEHGINVQAIHAFEPDPENFEVLLSYVQQSKQSVIAQQIGLWSSAQVLTFSNNQTVSYGRKIDETGSTSIETTSIDEYAKSQSIVPTVIKLDIEGAEQQALQGAANTISTLKPKLAISVYHIHSDLWRLPAYIKTLNPNYQFYLGHHRTNWMETVLYGC
jgi:FkbM family methyltransferase